MLLSEKRGLFKYLYVGYLRKMAKGIIRNWLSKFHEQFHKAARSKTSSHEIALGMAVGIFIGFLPFLGFQVLIGILAIFLFRINKITTLLGVFVTNPVTITPIFAFNYYINTFNEFCISIIII